MYVYFKLMKTKNVLSKKELKIIDKSNKRFVSNQGFKNINYNDFTFYYKGSKYKILSKRSKYPFCSCVVAKMYLTTDKNTGKTLIKWKRLSKRMIIPSSLSVAMRKKLYIPSGSFAIGFKNGLKPNEKPLFIKETSFTGKVNQDIDFSLNANNSKRVLGLTGHKKPLMVKSGFEVGTQKITN